MLLLGYLALPIDLIPDFVPILGFADDAIIVAFVLRSVTRRAGPDAVAKHWRAPPTGWRPFAGCAASQDPLTTPRRSFFAICHRKPSSDNGFGWV